MSPATPTINFALKDGVAPVWLSVCATASSTPDKWTLWVDGRKKYELPNAKYPAPVTTEFAVDTQIVSGNHKVTIQAWFAGKVVKEVRNITIK